MVFVKTQVNFEFLIIHAFRNEFALISKFSEFAKQENFRLMLICEQKGFRQIPSIFPTCGRFAILTKIMSGMGKFFYFLFPWIGIQI